MACPTCGAAVLPGAKFCDSCGVELLPGVPRSTAPVATPKECPFCKKPNRADATYCANCGIGLKARSLPLSSGSDAFATFTEDYWLVRFILAGIAGFILFLAALAVNQLVLALVFGMVAIMGLAGTFFMMGRHP